MKVTKYPQSCLLLEKDGKRIVIDPGSFFAAKYDVSELGQVDAVLYTHQHQDHFDQGIADQLKQAKVPMYGNEAVCKLIGNEDCQVKSGAGFTVAGFSVLPIDVPHFQLPDGSEGPQNTAFVIDVALIHPGDSSKHHEKLQAKAVAATIGAPSGEVFAREMVAFIRAAGATRAIPIHYDHYKFDPEEFAKLATGIEVTVLADGESTEL